MRPRRTSSPLENPTKIYTVTQQEHRAKRGALPGGALDPSAVRGDSPRTPPCAWDTKSAPELSGASRCPPTPWCFRRVAGNRTAHRESTPHHENALPPPPQSSGFSKPLPLSAFMQSGFSAHVIKKRCRRQAFPPTAPHEDGFGLRQLFTRRTVRLRLPPMSEVTVTLPGFEVTPVRVRV